MLYPEFKNTYFKTLDNYITYIQKAYPEDVSIEYEDIEMQGTIFIVSITIKDLANYQAEGKEQKIIVRETDLNEFVISFQVEEEYLDKDNT